MKIEELISKARGRTILIGEHHVDRTTICRTNELMIRADKAGYSTFGAEISQEGRSPYWGLREELEFLNQIPQNAVLSGYDKHSDMDADTTLAKIRGQTAIGNYNKRLRWTGKFLPLIPFIGNGCRTRKKDI